MGNVWLGEGRRLDLASLQLDCCCNSISLLGDLRGLVYYHVFTLYVVTQLPNYRNNNKDDGELRTRPKYEQYMQRRLP